MRTTWTIAAIAAATFLTSSALAQVADDAKQVLTESAEAIKKAESITFKSRCYGTSILKDIIDSDGTVKMWRPGPGQPFTVWVDGRVKRPGQSDKKQMSVHTPKSVTWLDWEKNLLMERAVTDVAAVSETNISGQILLGEFTMPNPFQHEMTLGKLTKKGVDNVNGEVCDIIEATPLDESRNFTWAISVKDRLPRRLEKGNGKDQNKFGMIIELSDVKVGEKYAAKDFEIALPPGFEPDRKVAVAAPSPAQPVNQPAMPAPAPVELGLKVGAPAPAFAAKAIDGKDVSLDSMKGNVVVMEFWGTIFKQSTAHSAEMQTLATDFNGKNVNFVGLACRELTEKTAPAYWNANKMSYPLVADGNDIATTYKVSGFPSYYIIGADGNVKAFFQGFPGKDQMQKAIADASEK